MPRTDDGEFELVLGNKQLLSVFFIVVVLLGVFFTMGYIVGKNTAPDVTARRAEPIVVDPAGRPTPLPSAVVTPQVMETPTPTARPTPTAEPTLAPTPRPTAAVKPTPTPKPTATPTPEPTKGSQIRVASGQPGPGQTFLQVVASTRADCEIISDVLRRKGFSTAVTPGPNETVFRVLVGPLADRDDIAKTRSKLEEAGFKNPYLRKF